MTSLSRSFSRRTHTRKMMGQMLLAELGRENIDVRKTLDLVSGGADLAQVSATGETALIRAARLGLTDVTKALAWGGAALDGADNAGNTALIAAAAHGHGEAVRILVGRGAKLDEKNIRRQTAQTLAQERGYAAIVMMIGEARMLAGPARATPALLPATAARAFGKARLA